MGSHTTGMRVSEIIFCFKDMTDEAVLWSLPERQGWYTHEWRYQSRSDGKSLMSHLTQVRHNTKGEITEIRFEKPDGSISKWLPVYRKR